MSTKMYTAMLITMAITTFVHAHVAQGQQVVTDGLVSFWTFDKSDVSATSVKDIVGKNDCAIVGKPQTVAGKIGEAIEFAGAGDYLDCGNDKSLDLTDEITIELWIQPTSPGEGGPNAGPVCKAQQGVDWSWQLRYNAPGGFMGFQYNAEGGGSTWISVQKKLDPGTWFHIAGTVDGNEIKCYLDGVETEKTKMDKIGGGNGAFFIGQDGWVNIFKGVVDEVRIYDRALKADEIQHNFEAKSQLAVEPAQKLATAWGAVKAVSKTARR